MDIYLVGGAVRDKLLGRPVTERDWVVVGATPEAMIELGYQPVGKDFPVFLHPQSKEEYALARKERKTGRGYHGFTFYTAPTVSLEEDLERRDLTINAIAEADDGELIDLFDGRDDLQNRILRHVSPAFVEDPVRILRVARFAARFAQPRFEVAAETLALMQHMVKHGEVDALVAERVWKEFERALREQQPSRFIDVLHQCGALSRLFPAFERLYQSPHPQAFQSKAITLSLQMIDRAAALQRPSSIGFACLCHTLSENDIRRVAEAYRVPREHHELARLLAKHYRECLQADDLDADTLLNIFISCDAFRQLKRFTLFLSACDIVGDILGMRSSNKLLQRGLQTCLTINVQQLIGKATLSGPEIAELLKRARLERLGDLLNRPRDD